MNFFSNVWNGITAGTFTFEDVGKDFYATFMLSSFNTAAPLLGGLGMVGSKAACDAWATSG